MMIHVVIPPDMPERQAQAIEAVERMAAERRSTFAHQDFVKRRQAALLARNNSHALPAGASKDESVLNFTDMQGGKAGPSSGYSKPLPVNSSPLDPQTERKL